MLPRRGGAREKHDLGPGRPDLAEVAAAPPTCGGDPALHRVLHRHHGGIHPLLLQSHHHRAEHWIVVEGTAKVTIGEEVQLVSENQSVYIPLGAMHRMENPGKVPLTLV